MTTTISTNLTLSPGSLEGVLVNFYDNESFAFEVERIGLEAVNMALAETETITSFLRDYPEQVATMVNHVLTGQTETAREVASNIGITAEAFQEGGVNLLWWFMILLAILMIMIAVIYCSHHPEACEDR
ncbi:hypothetical protein [Neobacillus vireti]|uniref:hypothetical protein n=1 Tax=Neobacillus vireti TaxID=220686 RepID=UPI002FFF3970